MLKGVGGQDRDVVGDMFDSIFMGDFADFRADFGGKLEVVFGSRV